jgi:hypothetical protein
VSERNWNRTIVFTPDKNSGEEPARGLLVGCSADQVTAFIRVRVSRRRTKVVKAPTDKCHFARRRKGEAEEDAAPRRTGALPLFDLREAPAATKGRARESKVDKAA